MTKAQLLKKKAKAQMLEMKKLKKAQKKEKKLKKAQKKEKKLKKAKIMKMLEIKTKGTQIEKWPNVLETQQDAESFVENIEICKDDDSYEIAQELAKNIFDAAVTDIHQMLMGKSEENTT